MAEVTFTLEAAVARFDKEVKSWCEAENINPSNIKVEGKYLHLSVPKEQSAKVRGLLEGPSSPTGMYCATIPSPIQHMSAKIVEGKGHSGIQQSRSKAAGLGIKIGAFPSELVRTDE